MEAIQAVRLHLWLTKPKKRARCFSAVVSRPANSLRVTEAILSFRDMSDMTVTSGSVRAVARCVALVFMAVFLFVACSAKEDIVYCPTIRVPQDTGVLTRFVSGSDGDITDVRLEGRFIAARGVCTVDDDEVAVEAYLEVGVREGPASKSKVGEISMFVAVADQNRNILQRRSLPVAIDFSGNRSTLRHIERLTIGIPKSPAQRGDEFVIFAGFEMTREELEFNRETQ